MKAWLCMNPVDLHTDLSGINVSLPKDVVELLCVFRTKKAARAMLGKDCILTEVSVPKSKEEK